MASCGETTGPDERNVVMKDPRIPTVLPVLLALLVALPAVAGCENEGDEFTTITSTPVAVPDTAIRQDEDLPGLNITIRELRNFRRGARPSVTFTVQTDAGIDMPLGVLDFGEILFSGPARNYQRVLYERDLLSARDHGDGTWTYTFPDPIPSTYPSQANADPASAVDPADEWTGDPLVDGTYTLGMAVYRFYTVEGEQVRDVENLTEHMTFGPTANTVDTRDVVAQANCDQCHGDLRAHGAIRRDVSYCLLCHTAGAEDHPAAGTSLENNDVTIEFEEMIHRIHNGAHLPSVNGVAQEGSLRDFQVTPIPYVVAGFRGSPHDYSDIQFPMWPNLEMGMPQDANYDDDSETVAGTAGSFDTGAEDAILRGVTACDACHDDPDGTGPLSAPDDGSLAFTVTDAADTTEDSLSTCTSCHDDMFPGSQTIYEVNGSGMDLTADTDCAACHTPTDLEANHLHPIEDPTLNPGLQVVLDSVQDLEPDTTPNPTSYAAGDGTFQVGEKVEVEFAVQDDAGTTIDISTLDPGLGGLGIVVGLAGPTFNMNQVLESSIPPSRFANTTQASYTTPLPESRRFQVLTPGATGATGNVDTFTDSSLEIWEDSGGTPIDVTIREIDVDAAAEGSSNPTSATAEQQNFIDLADASAFAEGDFVQVGATGGATTEYRVIDLIHASQPDRIWFGVPLRHAHATTETVTAWDPANVATLTQGTDYTVDGPDGQIVEPTASTWTTGDVVVASYIRDFLWPDVYRPPFNDTDELDDEWGEWAGKAMESGTYRLGIWTDDPSYVTGVGPQNQTYPEGAEAAIENLLFGGASTVEPYDLIARGDLVADEFNCNACHDQIAFHGDHRWGVDTCLQCHGLAGAEDVSLLTDALEGWPLFGPNQEPADTPETTINFRSMIHSIHRGANLHSYNNNDSTDDYNVVGFSNSNHFYDFVHFPVMNGGTASCTACHGSGNDAWELPAPRTHSDPSEQPVPTQQWHAACLSCHDSPGEEAHADLMTAASGFESCQACHGPGHDQAVDVVHESESR